MIIGVDFDNTIVDYDAVFRAVAEDMGCLSPGDGDGKAAVRDAVRALPDGERQWRDIQAAVYGPRILEAVPFDGVLSFLRRCRDAGMTVHVVSHKTVFAASDKAESCNLHEAAMKWLGRYGVVGGREPLLEKGNVFFEPTRERKLSVIARLGCDLFIDDLEEVLVHPDFPVGTRALWFAPHDGPARSGLVAVRHWSEMNSLFENGNG